MRFTAISSTLRGPKQHVQPPAADTILAEASQQGHGDEACNLRVPQQTEGKDAASLCCQASLCESAIAEVYIQPCVCMFLLCAREFKKKFMSSMQ